MKTNKHDATIFTGLLSFFWLLAVFVGYGYIHKSFLPGELIGGLLVILRTLISIIICSLAGGNGMSTSFRKLSFSPLTQAVPASALGIGVISIPMLVSAATAGINS